MKEKTIIGIIITIILLVALLIYLNIQPRPFLSINYYDQEGNLINNAYSIIVPTLAYSFDLTVVVVNNGDVTLNCQPIFFSPNELDSSFQSRNSMIVSPGKSGEWTSNKMLVSTFLSKPQPINFNVSVRCSSQGYINNSYYDQSGSIDLQVKNICGDGICQIGEDSVNCPFDCFIPHNSVIKFRTSDLKYALTTHAIAFTNTCGGSLTRAGFSSKTCWAVTDSTCPVVSGYTLIWDSPTLPGNPLWAGTKACFYSYGSKYALAWKTSNTASGPCTILGRWGVNIYDPASSYSTNVDSSIYSINYSKESLCSNVVKFRTQSNDLNKDSGGIALNTAGYPFDITCNNSNLLGLGVSASDISSYQNCQNAMSGKTFLFKLPIINSVSAGSNVATNNIGLWKGSYGFFTICGDTSNGKATWVSYYVGNSTSISTIGISIDSSKEVNC